MQNVPNNQSEKKPDIEIKDELQSEEESNNETLKNPKRSMKTECNNIFQ